MAIDKVNAYYNIITKYPNILGAQLNNLQLKGILPYDEAIKIFNIIEQHNNVLKVTVVSDTINSLNYKNFTYFHFMDNNGNIYMIPMEYIHSYSVSGNEFNFKVSNISNADIEIIKRILLTNGYTLQVIS